MRMAKMAVDAVLLPSETMASRAIEANRRLSKQASGRIVLDKENCLPHISLAMGCIDEEDIVDIEKILKSIAKRYCAQELKVVGIRVGTNSVGEKVSVFQIKKNEPLQSLHEEVMRSLMPYFRYDVTMDSVYSPPRAEESTLLWIRGYTEKASFESFFPHITIGYGQVDDLSFPIKFTASRLALCHLGNHCTCRKVLALTRLKGRG
jgi:2'-5' RNA ligase